MSLFHAALVFLAGLIHREQSGLRAWATEPGFENLLGALRQKICVFKGPKMRPPAETCKKFSCLAVVLMLSSICRARSQSRQFSSNPTAVPLTVDTDVPIRAVIEKPVRIKNPGEPVEARVIQPVYVFNRQVIPADSLLIGKIAKIDPVSKKQRLLALANGNLTPFHQAHIEFDTLVLKDGRRFPILTDVSPGTKNVIQLVAGSKNKKGGFVRGKVSGVRRQIAQSEHEAIAAIKTPHKLRRVESVLSAEMPFHRQFLPAGTQFTVTLRKPLRLGTEDISPEQLTSAGGEIPPSSTVKVWLATPLSSAKDHKGSPVEAVVSQPLYSKNHKLILPAGSRLEGVVTRAVPARRLNRNGKLRFTFQRIELPQGTARKVEAGLQAAAVAKSAHLKIDSEGGAHAVSSKRKYVMPAIVVLLAMSSFDGDSQSRAIQEGGGQGGDVAGGAIRGGVGLGVLGSVIAMAGRSQPVTAGFAFYGAATSVYSHLVARGSDVVFPKGTPMEIRFGTHEGETPPSRRATSPTHAVSHPDHPA